MTSSPALKGKMRFTRLEQWWFVFTTPCSLGWNFVRAGCCRGFPLPRGQNHRTAFSVVTDALVRWLLGTSLPNNLSGEAGVFYRLPAQDFRGREHGCWRATWCPWSEFFTAALPKSWSLPGTSPRSVLWKCKSGIKESRQQTGTDLG